MAEVTLGPKRHARLQPVPANSDTCLLSSTEVGLLINGGIIDHQPLQKLRGIELRTHLLGQQG